MVLGEQHRPQHSDTLKPSLQWTVMGVKLRCDAWGCPTTLVPFESFIMNFKANSVFTCRVCDFISQGSRGHVLIEFERSKKPPKVKAGFRMQETPLYDLIHHEDGRWQPVAAGDRVLAPWEKKGERYGPGTVLQVTETGSSHSGTVAGVPWQVSSHSLPQSTL